MLHGCLKTGALYDEDTSWATSTNVPLDTTRTWDVCRDEAERAHPVTDRLRRALAARSP